MPKPPLAPSTMTSLISAIASCSNHSKIKLSFRADGTGPPFSGRARIHLEEMTTCVGCGKSAEDGVLVQVCAGARCGWSCVIPSSALASTRKETHRILNRFSALLLRAVACAHLRPESARRRARLLTASAANLRLKPSQGKTFHPECFKCKACSCALTGVQFFSTPAGDVQVHPSVPSCFV